MLPVELSILTLNVWGIPLVSCDRQVRIGAIGTELSSGRYDIVSLQEVWSQKDSELLQEKTAAVLPYAHYFYSGVIGSGLLVLSKYPIIGTLFHAWSVNGYFHRIQHADWFGGKGVGLCRILIDDQVVHLYNAHLHAEYDNENDEYKTHRVIQAFDTAQFIRATRDDSTLQILAGDLNTQPTDISYKVLLYTSKMRDCCLSSAIATNECQRNSYTSKRTLAKNPAGIRIDHIFMRSPEHIEVAITKYVLPLSERVPGHKFSYSDHEAVLATLRLSTRSSELLRSGSCPARVQNNSGDTAPGDSPVGAIAALQQCNGNDQQRETAIRNRIAVLHEAIALCETSLQQLKVDRIVYYVVSVFVAFLLIALAEYTVPHGFKTLSLLLKFLLFVVVLFCVFMGSIWNYMERNGVLSGKMDMEMMLRCTEKFELGLSS